MKKFLMLLFLFFSINSFARSPYDEMYDFSYSGTLFDFQSLRYYNKGSFNGFYSIYRVRHNYSSAWILKNSYDGPIFFCLYKNLYRSINIYSPYFSNMTGTQLRIYSPFLYNKYSIDYAGAMKDSFSLVPYLPYPTLSEYLSTRSITELEAQTIINNTRQAIERTANILRNSQDCGIYNEVPYVDDVSNPQNFLIDPTTLQIYPIDFGEMAPNFPEDSFMDLTAYIYSHVTKMRKKPNRYDNF